jgi:hypothetical protein
LFLVAIHDILAGLHFRLRGALSGRGVPFLALPGPGFHLRGTCLALLFSAHFHELLGIQSQECSLIPAPHHEVDQITFFFKLPINGKAPLALVFCDVCHKPVSTGSVEFWAQRQIKRATQNRLNFRGKIPRRLFLDGQMNLQR